MAERGAPRQRGKTQFAPVRIVGCMSGTSLDGVDAAEIVTDGETVSAFGPTAYRPYTAAEREILRAGLGHWSGTAEAEAAARVVEAAHAEILAQFGQAEAIGFHGQTLAHDPGGRGTHQAGDGSALARATGKKVVWDFRSTDVALGGQGAPLAPAYHHALARRLGATEPLVFLNLGGVGNVTWVDPTVPRPDDAGAVLAFDTGPANAPLDDLMRQRRGQTCDRDGALATTGRLDDDVLARLLAHGFFRKMPPKSLDRDDFAWLGAAVAPLSDADAAATLTAAAAVSVSLAMEHMPRAPTRVLVAGGGRKNPILMAMLAAGLDVPVQPVEDVKLDGDMLEAQAFAFLAARVLRGLPTSFPATTGVTTAVGGGEVSLPQ